MNGNENEPATTGGSTGFVILLAGAAALGGFLFGFDTAVINGAENALSAHFALSDWGKGLAVSLALLGSAAGAWFAGSIADRIGRTRTMVIAAAFFLVSAVGSGSPFAFADFVAWRVLGGIGVGAASVIAPAYIAEVSPAAQRGRLGSLQQLAIVVGIFAAQLTDYGFSHAAGGAAQPWLGIAAWRWMFWAEAPAAVIFGIAALAIPESPRYLVAKGLHEQARRILARVEGTAARLGEIEASLKTEHAPRFQDILSGGTGLLPIVWIGVGLAALQQFVGINVIFYYSTELWEAVGFSEDDALKLTIISGMVNIVTTLVAIALIDRCGRKPLLLAGSLGMALTLGTLACVFAAAPVVDGAPELGTSAGRVALAAANLYVFCFGFSWGPILWVLLGEMFNNRIRALALAVGCATNWLANFLVATTFPEIMSALGLGTAYGLYTVAAAVSFFFVIFLVPETKGRTLEEM